MSDPHGRLVTGQVAPTRTPGHSGWQWSAYRHIVKACRTLHVYLTLFGLALILLFAVTGFMLNHEDWFLPTEPHTRTTEGIIPTAVLAPVDKFEVSEAVRRQFGVAGNVNSFRDDEEEVEVEYIRPGERSVALIRKESGEVTVTHEAHGWAGVLTDLHKGKSAGRAWGLVIDGVCVLLTVVSATGFVLWLSLKSRARLGAAVILIGTGVAGAVFYWLVP